MLDSLLSGLGGMIDKEQITIDTIQDTLEKLSKELNCRFSDLFIMIKPKSEDFSFRCDVFKYENGKPIHVREITVAEIVGKK